jgi:hypothetical protein
MRSGSKLVVRPGLAVYRRGSNCFLYNPLWRTPVLVNEAAAGLVRLFAEPRPSDELSPYGEAMTSKVRELEKAGVIGDAKLADADALRTATFPDGDLFRPNRLAVICSGRGDPDVSRQIAHTAQFVIDLVRVSDVTFSLSVRGLDTMPRWRLLCRLLEEIWQRLDFLDHLEVFLDMPPILPSEDVLRSLRPFSLGIRVLVQNPESDEAFAALEALLQQGRPVLPTLRVTPDKQVVRRALERCAGYGVPTVSIEPDEEVLRRPPAEVFSWVMEMREICKDAGLRMLAFWDMPAYVFQARKQPAALYLPLQVDFAPGRGSIGNASLPIETLGLAAVDRSRRGAAATLPLVDCAGCLAVGLCMGAVRRRYARHERICCGLTHKMIQIFLEQQLEIVTGGTQ